VSRIHAARVYFQATVWSFFSCFSLSIARGRHFCAPRLYAVEAYAPRGTDYCAARRLSSRQSATGGATALF